MERSGVTTNDGPPRFLKAKVVFRPLSQALSILAPPLPRHDVLELEVETIGHNWHDFGIKFVNMARVKGRTLGIDMMQWRWMYTESLP